MRSAIEVANWFIVEHDVTHLKLQKLLYIAFGLHYAEKQEALFYDQFEAWHFGPVLQNIYLHLKWYGRERITRPIELFDFVPKVEDPAVIQTLSLTWEIFGGKTASELVAWTHADGGPWDKAYDEKEESGTRRILPMGSAEIARWFTEFWQELHPAPKVVGRKAR